MELDYVDDTVSSWPCVCSAVRVLMTFKTWTQDGKRWCIIDTAWLNSWLAYVHLDKQNAPAPGPCNNIRLIEWDAVQGRWIGRHGLLMSNKNFAGDFRRISRETWQKFKEFYPGSGPTITMDFTPSMNNGEEPYIGKHFTIVDPPPAPKVVISKSKKKKALAAAAAAEAAEKAAAAKTAAEAAAAAKAAAAAAQGVSPGGYGSDDDAQSERSVSRSVSMSSVSVSSNKPKVVSNLPPPPGQIRNPVAEQFARQAMEQAQEDTFRASERSQSVASQSGAGYSASLRYGSFSAGSAKPPSPPSPAPAPAPAPAVVSSLSSGSHCGVYQYDLLHFVMFPDGEGHVLRQGLRNDLSCCA